LPSPPETTFPKEGMVFPSEEELGALILGRDSVAWRIHSDPC
jgi:hypothetical protein